MADAVTLQQVEEMAAQLPAADKARLVADVTEWLRNQRPDDRDRVAQAEALLAELDAIAESIEGVFDSAADIRQIREERADRL